MYPLAHLYLTKKALNRLTPTLALGSVLPDVLTSAGLDWQTAHSYKRSTHINRDLLLGDLIHGISLPGLDYYSDISYRNQAGFAFQNAKYLAKDLAALKVPEKDVIWRGHNFIEMAVETFLNKTQHRLWLELSRAAADQKLLQTVKVVMNDYKVDNPDSITAILDRFLKMGGKEDLLAEDYAHKLNSIYGLEIETKQCLALIKKAQQLVEGRYQEFLQTAIKEIKINVKNY
ncbi:hypothetical protein RDV78_01200 [Bacillota bacterium LX-D]|nr:hypothetical protein [Bacillota bacterium LX-D]